jgi:hypothetical protein
MAASPDDQPLFCNGHEIQQAPGKALQLNAVLFVQY